MAGIEQAQREKFRKETSQACMRFVRRKWIARDRAALGLQRVFRGQLGRMRAKLMKEMTRIAGGAHSEWMEVKETREYTRVAAIHYFVLPLRCTRSSQAGVSSRDHANEEGIMQKGTVSFLMKGVPSKIVQLNIFTQIWYLCTRLINFSVLTRSSPRFYPYMSVTDDDIVVIVVVSSPRVKTSRNERHKHRLSPTTTAYYFLSCLL